MPESGQRDSGDPGLHYTPADGPHGHWQITDHTGRVLVCPHQAPAPELLERLGITAPEAGVGEPAGGGGDDEATVPTPAEIPESTPQVAEFPARPKPEWSTDTAQGDGPTDPRYWTAEARWSRLPSPSPTGIIPGARTAMDYLEVAPETVREVVADPEWVETERGDAIACFRADDQGIVRVVVGADGTVLHVRRDPTATPDKRRASAVGLRAATTSGPRRLPAPTDLASLKARLKAHGFIVTRGGKHDTVMHPRLPGMVTLPLTPSDHRWIHNAISEIRSRFGIDVRSTPEP